MLFRVECSCWSYILTVGVIAKYQILRRKNVRCKQRWRVRARPFARTCLLYVMHQNDSISMLVGLNASIKGNMLRRLLHLTTQNTDVANSCVKPISCKSGGTDHFKQHSVQKLTWVDFQLSRSCKPLKNKLKRTIVTSIYVDEESVSLRASNRRMWPKHRTQKDANTHTRHIKYTNARRSQKETSIFRWHQTRLGKTSCWYS